MGKIKADENQVKSIISKDKSLLYKAKIKVYNKRYSGLVLLKQVDPQTAHLTFVTEIGMKIFDFEIKDTAFNLVYIFEPLNKPRIIRLLTNDMKVILMRDLVNKQAELYEKSGKKIFRTKAANKTFYFSSKPKLINKSLVKGKLLTKEKVTYLYNDSLEASQIKLKHRGLVRVKIDLNKVSGSSKTN
ncbi:MAG: hypothetical protein JNL60_05085 [Bacteroidia bacterium]|nr:hypothetical protein [Bacteroidia bacterium]